MKTTLTPPRPLTQEAAELQNILILSPEHPTEARIANCLRKHGFQRIYICTDPIRCGDMLRKHDIHVIVLFTSQSKMELPVLFEPKRCRLIRLPGRDGYLDEARWRKVLLSGLLCRTKGGAK